MGDTLGDILRKHFTRETWLCIKSEEHHFTESNETDCSEFFSGDVGEFLERDNMKEFRDLDSVEDCDITFDAMDCMIFVTVYDHVLQD